MGWQALMGDTKKCWPGFRPSQSLPVKLRPHRPTPGRMWPPNFTSGSREVSTKREAEARPTFQARAFEGQPPEAAQPGPAARYAPCTGPIPRQAAAHQRRVLNTGRHRAVHLTWQAKSVLATQHAQARRCGSFRPGRVWLTAMQAPACSRPAHHSVRRTEGLQFAGWGVGGPEALRSARCPRATEL